MGMPVAILGFFALDFLLPAVYLTNAAMAEPLGTGVSYLINLDGESNLPAWYSTVKLFLIGYLLLLYADSINTAKQRGALSVNLLAIIFIFMSFDEMVGIHERIGVLSDVFLPGQDRINSVFPATGIWMFVVLAPAFAFILYLLYKLRDQGIPANIYRLFVAGLVIFVVSAGGIEILANYSGEGALGMLQISAEEFGEMIGATIMLWATYKLLGNPNRALFD